MLSLRRAFIGLSIAWTALLFVVPYLASQPHASSAVTALIVAGYAVGSAICHQLPDRSYHLWTAQIPVCARCAGIYVGAAMAAIVLSVARGFPPSLKRRRTAEALSAFAPSATARPRRSSKSVVGAEAGPPRDRGPERAARQRAIPARAALLAAALPTALTLVYEWFTGDTPANWIRAAAGLPIGAVVAVLVISACGHAGTRAHRRGPPNVQFQRNVR
jgi:hypothetical protein